MNSQAMFGAFASHHPNEHFLNQMPLTEQQQTELTRSLHQSHGSFELAMAPVLMALIGLGLDRWLGTAPLLTIILPIMGVVGSTIKVLYTYRAKMAVLDSASPWATQPAAAAADSVVLEDSVAADGAQA
jgi:F0F1-type ATP synthase assembly protein I